MALKKEFNVDACSTVTGLTVLQLACVTGSQSLFDCIMKKYPVLGVCSAQGFTAAYYAAKFGREELLLKLLASEKSCLTPSAGQLSKILDADLVRENDKRMLADWCRTPLHASIENGHYKITEILLNHALQINDAKCILSHDRNAFTPLMLAARNKDEATMKLFCKAGIWMSEEDIQIVLSTVQLEKEQKAILKAIKNAFSDHKEQLKDEIAHSKQRPSPHP